MTERLLYRADEDEDRLEPAEDDGSNLDYHKRAARKNTDYEGVYSGDRAAEFENSFEDDNNQLDSPRDTE